MSGDRTGGPAGYSGAALVRKLSFRPGARAHYVKVCAIDATWSGLKLVIRRELR